ncbi:MAG: TldD/PmbA family protein [Thermofilaceae archaeon]
MSLVEEVAKYALKLGADEAFVTLSKARVYRAEIESDEIARVSSAVVERLSITVIKDQKIAAATVNEVDRDSAMKCAERAYKLALVVKPNENWKSLPEPKPLPVIDGLFDHHIEFLGPEEIVEMAKRLLDTAHEVSNKVSLMSAGIEAATAETEMFSTTGTYGSQKATMFGAEAGAVAREAGIVGSFSFTSDASHSFDVDIDQIAREAASKALESLHLKPVPAFKGTLLLDRDFAAELFLSLAQAYSGYNVWSGSSPLAGKLNRQVSSELLTVVDDGTLPGGLRSSSFDGEGSPTVRKTVVEHGILKTYINNTFTARLLGMQPTGNAADLLSVAPSNTIVQAGDMSLEEMVSGVKQGLFVSRFSGMIRFQDGVISGAAKQAFYIENSEKKYAVGECMISCNLYDLIRNISGLSRESKRTVYGVYTPIIRAENVVFVGKV